MAVTAAASRSTTRSCPVSTVTSRVPSVQARSGSPTPGSWVLVLELPSAPAALVGADAEESDADMAPDDPLAPDSNSAAPRAMLGWPFPVSSP